MQSGSLHGHHEEQQVVCMAGVQKQTWGKRQARGQLEGKVARFSCWALGRPGTGRTLRPLLWFLLEREAGRGETNVTAPGRPCGVLVLGAAAGEDTSGGVGG